MIITIDGPSGTGKSTAARQLAKRLGYLYLDTGAMYRAVGLKALEKKIPLTERGALVKLAARSRITFRVDPGHRLRVLLDGADVTEAIRRPEVSEAASRVATIPALRRALVRQQKGLGARGRVVAEGRDTGTVVFPSAPLKFFLTASAKERARRRLNDLRKMGHPASLSQVLEEVKRRDLRDRHRTASPLRVPKGAVRIDNTGLKSNQVIAIMVDYAQRILHRNRRRGIHGRRAV
ncbi:MAG: (d)CMP kinase [Candidatus Omnitrophica bacterium]|nr:(d)CMP kinase [Candidatus Omnitrophota bacterium]